MGDNAVAQFPRGDLIIVVKYKKDKYWRADGPNVTAVEKLNIIELLKGTKIDITTLEGNTIRLNIPKGTNPGTTFSINGAGLPINHRQRGNVEPMRVIKMVSQSLFVINA